MPLPAPVTWTDGEDPFNIPSADDLNFNWKDSFDFLMGNTRPIGLFRSTTTTQNITTTFLDINLPTEVIKRGGLVHSTSSNTHLITVPYTGQYAGYASGSFDGASATGLRLIVRVLKNGTTEIGRFSITNAQLGHFTVNGSFTADLTANDTINMQMALSSGTATTGSLPGRVSRLGIWYAGDF